MFLGLYDVPKLTIKIIQEHDEGEQKRKHRKKRINKKWLKRYGVYGKQWLDKDKVLIFGDVAYMSRPHFMKLKKDLSWQKHDVLSNL